ncbi:hypothetical protein CEXT_547631 [Caerostris extrusa]|uniref:Uncharacterized protein n=1 Tax=Caerostris extrusa TaxID=172846 RepID=A0AAV4N2L4_CAEEX|nr:hypothetical protein CEXT_547631 [Caerostris extrusa]
MEEYRSRQTISRLQRPVLWGGLPILFESITEWKTCGGTSNDTHVFIELDTGHAMHSREGPISSAEPFFS